MSHLDSHVAGAHQSDNPFLHRDRYSPLGDLNKGRKSNDRYSPDNHIVLLNIQYYQALKIST